MTKIIRLADVLDGFETGKRPRGGAVGSGVPSLGGEHVTSEAQIKLDPMRYVPHSFFAQMTTGRVAIHDVLVVKDGATTGRVGIVDSDFPFSEAGINEHLFLLRANRKLLDPRYLYFYLRSESGQAQIMSDFRGAAQGGITRGIGDKVRLPLPAIADQCRIVHLLSSAESIVRMRREAEQKAKEIIPALFLNMFGHLATNAAGERSETRLNADSAPAIAGTKLLGDLVDHERGITYGVVQRGDEYAGGVPVIRIGDFVENAWAPRDIAYTDPEISRKYSRTVLQGGEIVVSIRGTIGRTAIVPSSAAGWNVAREVAVVPLLPGVSRAYIHGFLQSDTAQSFFLRETRGVAQRGINLEDLRNLTVPMPMPATAARYEDYVSRLDRVVKDQSAAVELATSAFHSLLAGAFSLGCAA